MSTRSLLLLMMLSACHSIEISPRPPEGYDAIKLHQTVQFDDVLGWNTVRIPAATILVADRPPYGGKKRYCGVIYLNNNLSEGCFLYFDGELMTVSMRLIQEMPLGSVEFLKM
jgi:hypothetical protein